jgi:GntR family transcriptional regulator
MTMALLRESPTPLYLQLKSSLSDEINSGGLAPDQRLPSERELCERYNVSRMTVRQAMAELIRDGMVYAVVGKGTFVSEPKINQELRSLTGFTDDVRRRGGRPGSQVIEARLVSAGTRLTQKLRLPPGAELVLLSRLRLSNGIPLALETAYLPHMLCPGLLQHDLASGSLYAVLEDHYNLRLVRAEQAITAGLANPNELVLLQLHPPAPILRIERTTFTAQDVAVEVVESAYRSDRYQFRAILYPTA